MACTRVLERVLAATGHLNEAPSEFKTAFDVPNGGVLWALPALLSNGLLQHTQKHFQLPKGFYGLAQIFILLAFMALCRIKSIEQLRYNSAGEFGNLLGLDRIPEVRTLRQKIQHLSETGEVSKWSEILSREWMDNDPEAAGTLYVDGHVRVYHGSQTDLPKRYVTRERLCLRGMMDYWVNDQEGTPYFVVTTPFNAGLLDMLEKEIVPRLLKDVPHQPTEEILNTHRYQHRFTIVFDREGYSPEFFKKQKAQRIACLTYHKFPKDPWPAQEFQEHIVSMNGSENVSMQLAERGTFLSGIWVREIRKLTQTGHQTSIVSTDYISDHTDLAIRMFSRWAQENFFRYMMEHFNIDALVDHQTHQICDPKNVVNPVYRDLSHQIKKQTSLLNQRLKEWGKYTLNEDEFLESVPDYSQKKATLKESIEQTEMALNQIKAKRKGTPQHISFADLPPDQQFTEFSPKKKLFLDTIKMVAYRAETSMANLLKEWMAKKDEARALLRDLFTMEADLIPDKNAHTLTVQIHHFTNPVSDQIIQHLAPHLNDTETLFPGTNLRMVFKMVST